MAQDARPDMGACSGIPDIGAWQFVIPDGLRMGMLANSPWITGEIKSGPVLAGKLGDRIVMEGKLGADQT